MMDIDLNKYDFEFNFRFCKKQSNFKQLWNMKSIARESLKEWLIVSNVEPKLADRCANAGGELIENCIKYSINNSQSQAIIRVYGNTINLETKNHAFQKDIDELSYIVDEIHNTTNIKKLFAHRLLKSDSTHSQLGVVKIILETKGNISINHKSDNDMIHVIVNIKPQTLVSPAT